MKPPLLKYVIKYNPPPSRQAINDAIRKWWAHFSTPHLLQSGHWRVTAAFYDALILGLNNFLLEVALTRRTQVGNKEIRKTVTGGRKFNTEYLLMTAFQLERLHFSL